MDRVFRDGRAANNVHAPPLSFLSIHDDQVVAKRLQPEIGVHLDADQGLAPERVGVFGFGGVAVSPPYIVVELFTDHFLLPLAITSQGGGDVGGRGHQDDGAFHE